MFPSHAQCGGWQLRAQFSSSPSLSFDDIVEQCMAQTVIETATEREEIENILKSDLEANPASPGEFWWKQLCAH